MTDVLPPFYKEIRERFPTIAERHEAFSGACHDAGPLDGRTRHLVKLGVAVGTRSRGAVQSQVRQLADAGVTRAEIEHVALLAATTAGFPVAVAALQWIDSIYRARAET